MASLVEQARALQEQVRVLGRLADELVDRAVGEHLDDTAPPRLAAVPDPQPDLTDTEAALVALVQENGIVTRAWASEQIGIKPGGFARVVRRPSQLGLIEARGQTKARRYCRPDWPRTGNPPEPQRVEPVLPDSQLTYADDFRRRLKIILDDAGGVADDRLIARRMGIPLLELRPKLAALAANLELRVEKDGRYTAWSGLLAADSPRSDSGA